MTNEIKSAADEIKTSADLKKAIDKLEKKKDYQKKQLEDGFHEKLDSLKPRNLIRSSVHDLKSEPTLKKTLIIAAAGIVTILLVKKVLAKGMGSGAIKVMLSGLGAFGIKKALSQIKK